MSGIDCSVWIGKKRVGEIFALADETIQFCYDENWKLHGFALSPFLPLNGLFTVQDLLIFLENFLPEGQALEHLSRLKSISKNNILGLSLAIRNDLTGALSLRLTETTNTINESIRNISNEEILERLKHPEFKPMDIWDNCPRLSIAGMQTKLNVFKNGSHWALVDGEKLSSTHILKFEESTQKHLLLNEFLTMQLAKSLGHVVANVELSHIDEFRLLIVERFDRKISQQEDGSLKVLRRYMIDGCQACGVSSQKKYERNFGDSRDVAHIRDGVSFSKLFALVNYAKKPQFFKEELFDWLSFNLIVGNCDAHGKNISFFVNSAGLQITPWYDLVSVLQIPSVEHSMAMAIGDEFSPDHLHALQVLYEVNSLNLSASWACQRFAQTVKKLQVGLQKLNLTNDLNSEERDFFVRYKAFMQQRLDYWSKEAQIMPELAADKNLF